MDNQATVLTKRPSVWEGMSIIEKRIARLAVVLGFSQLILVDIYFRFQELPQINRYLSAGGSLDFVVDGIGYLPFVVSGLVCGGLVAASVVLVNSKARDGTAARLSWLGSAWLLASVVLVLDLMIDTFEVKWPVILLFAYLGGRYWNGSGPNLPGLVLAPTVALIAVLDGANHLSGQDCAQAGLDACSGKGVSDIYIVIVMVALTYVTLWRFSQHHSEGGSIPNPKARTTRPATMTREPRATDGRMKVA